MGEPPAPSNEKAADGRPVAAVLREHLWHHTPTTHCSCTWQATPSGEPVVEQWLTHVAAQLDTPKDDRPIMGPATNDWLEQVEARASAAPPSRVDDAGWGFDEAQGVVWTTVVAPDAHTGDATVAQVKICDAHPSAVPFIAHARTDLPRAVTLIRDLADQVEQANEQLSAGGQEWSRMAEQHEALTGQVNACEALLEQARTMIELIQEKVADAERPRVKFGDYTETPPVDPTVPTSELRALLETLPSGLLDPGRA